MSKRRPPHLKYGLTRTQKRAEIKIHHEDELAQEMEHILRKRMDKAHQALTYSKFFDHSDFEYHQERFKQCETDFYEFIEYNEKRREAND